MAVTWKRDFRIAVLISILLILSLPIASSDVHANEPVSDHEATAAGTETPSFCQKIQISRIGAVCKSAHGFTARLDFPLVDLESVVAGEQFLPNTETAFTVEDQVVGVERYRNIQFILRWESATPGFLQVYIADLAASWDSHGVPYRLLWRASYETCTAEACEHWTKVEDKGEYLPSNIPDLPENLAADSNFNGVPASFWNTNLVGK